VLKVGNHFRYSGLGNSKLLGCLRHAARVHDREKRMEVPQAEAPADLSFPMDSLGHMPIVIRVVADREFVLYPGPLPCKHEIEGRFAPSSRKNDDPLPAL
jgi:hypothetical protein